MKNLIIYWLTPVCRAWRKSSRSQRETEYNWHCLWKTHLSFSRSVFWGNLTLQNLKGLEELANLTVAFTFIISLWRSNEAFFNARLEHKQSSMPYLQVHWRPSKHKNIYFKNDDVKVEDKEKVKKKIYLAYCTVYANWDCIDKQLKNVLRAWWNKNE